MTHLTICCPNCGHASATEDRYPWLFKLTEQQRELMLILLDKPGMWFSLDKIVYMMYAHKANDEPDSAMANVAVQVYRIRKRIGNVIEGKRNWGYRVRVDKFGNLIDADSQHNERKACA